MQTQKVRCLALVPCRAPYCTTLVNTRFCVSGFPRYTFTAVLPRSDSEQQPTAVPQDDRRGAIGAADCRSEVIAGDEGRCMSPCRRAGTVCISAPPDNTCGAQGTILQEALTDVDQRASAAEATADKLEAENRVHVTRCGRDDPFLLHYMLATTASVHWSKSLLLCSRSSATCRGMHRNCRCWCRSCSGARHSARHSAHRCPSYQLCC